MELDVVEMRPPLTGMQMTISIISTETGVGKWGHSAPTVNAGSLAQQFEPTLKWSKQRSCSLFLAHR
jgi:hypothetical protein